MKTNKFNQWEKRYDGIVDEEMETGITRVYMTMSGLPVKVADEAAKRQRRREEREQEEEKKE